MHWNTFARSAAFAAVVAAGWLPWFVTVSPIVGPWTARAVYLTLVAATYVGGLTPRGNARLALAAMAAMLGATLVVFAHGTAELCIGLAAILGVARSAFLYRAAPARALTVEVALLGGGLLFARLLAATSPASTALGLWGFLLVQSFFFLVPATRTRSSGKPHGDPFEDAYRGALGLLDG